MGVPLRPHPKNVSNRIAREQEEAAIKRYVHPTPPLPLHALHEFSERQADKDIGVETSATTGAT